MELNGYEHKVQYYETDQMGCVHHSNYIRWFEEARTAIWNSWIWDTPGWRKKEFPARF